MLLKEKKTIILKNMSPVFIETGSYMGDAIHAVTETPKCKKIYSIEIDKHYFDLVTARFKGNKSVELIHGDSAHCLGNVISKIPKETRITFWLDGHYSGGDTGRGVLDFPIIKELNQINNSGRINDIIIIDDIASFRDPTPIVEVGITRSEVINAIMAINSNYILTYKELYCNKRKNMIDTILTARLSQSYKIISTLKNLWYF